MVDKQRTLLAPAGDMERLKMAVLYGADAVYLAGTDFGMRAFAGNFDPDELKAAVAYAHAHNVRVHCTINTMPRGDEIVRLPEHLERLNDAGVDAVPGGTVAVGHGDGAALGGNVQRIAAAGDGGLGEVGQGDTADLLTGDVDDHGEGAALVFGQIEAQRGDDGQQHDRQRHQRVKAVPFQFRRRGAGRHRRFRPFR